MASVIGRLTRCGIGAWSKEDIVQYLQTGHVPGKAQAAGPMAEAVQNSLQYLPAADLMAIATYLKDTPPIADAQARPRFAFGSASLTQEVSDRGNVQDAPAGWRVFSGSCAACHQAGAGGTGNGEYPSLFHNTTTGALRPDNLVATILHGVNRTAGTHVAFMPAFGDTASYTDRLNDQQIADVSNYVLSTYGNPQAHVSAADVATLRAGGRAPLLAQVRPFMLPLLVLVLLILVFTVARVRAAKTSKAS